MRGITIAWIVGPLALVLCVVAGAGAQELSLVVNPRTGDVEIRNTSNAGIQIDGYLLTATSPRFSPSNWDSLNADEVAGWFEGHAASNRLSEVNLGSFSTIDAGASLALGSPYLPFTPTQIGQLEPSFQFEYHVSGGNSMLGDVVFTPQNNVVLVVDPVDGTAALQNQSNFDVTIDGYLITSPTADALDPAGWTSWKDSGLAGPGWSESFAQPNRLGELTLLGSKLLPANGQPVPIGAPIDPAMLGSAADLVLEYHVAGESTLRGGVIVATSLAPPSLDGDYNGDGVVDAVDYTVWRNNLGDATEADINHNGDGDGVGPNDYTWWKQRYGNTAAGSGAGAGGLASASGAPVPEPAAWLSLFAASFCVPRRAFRDRRNRSC
jgi:hypothetical protein